MLGSALGSWVRWRFLQAPVTDKLTRALWRSVYLGGGGLAVFALALLPACGGGSGAKSQVVTVEAPAVTLSGTSLNFGSQNVGTTSSAQIVTITNSGNATLSISGIALAGTNSGDFSQTSTCGGSLSAGDSCTLTVTFKPLAVGTMSANVNISDNANNSPQSVALTGTGAATTLGSNSIASQFFAVNDVSGAPEPQVTYGLLGHPVPLAWQVIEQTQGVYDFTQFDPFVQIAPKDASGTALMVMTLGKTPPWAASDSTTCEVDTATDTTGCTSPPSNIQDWTDFITALLAHYNGVTEPHVKYYEIWNEVNSHWAGTAAQMEQLAAAAYPIIRQDPYSSVVGPSVSGNIHGTGANDPMVWLNSYLQAGGVHYQDIMSFHGFVYNSTVVPYPLPTEDCSASDANCGGAIQVAVELYNQVLQNNGVGTRPMFNTEGGFEGATLANTDTAEAWLAQYYALEVAMANTDNMQQVSWFTWGAPAGQLETTSGAVSPVGTAYDQLYAWFVGTVPVGACVNTGNLWTCSITGQNGYQGEVIWDQSQTCSPTCTTANQTVPSVYTDYRDLSGNATPITNSTVPVGLKPILLEN